MPARVSPFAVGHRIVLSVSGEIDMDSVSVLADAVDTALGAGAAELWIDLSSTTFMDSTGLHVLLGVRRRVRALKRHLAIICPPGPVRRVFDLTGVSEILPLYEDRATANRAA